MSASTAFGPGPIAPSLPIGDSGTVPTNVEQEKPLKRMHGMIATLEPATRHERRERNQSLSYVWGESAGCRTRVWYTYAGHPQAPPDQTALSESGSSGWAAAPSAGGNEIGAFAGRDQPWPRIPRLRTPRTLQSRHPL